MTENKETRGGSRGGGRPVSSRIKATFKIDTDVKEFLDTVPNKSDLVNKAIRHTFLKVNKKKDVR